MTAALATDLNDTFQDHTSRTAEISDDGAGWWTLIDSGTRYRLEKAGDGPELRWKLHQESTKPWAGISSFHLKEASFYDVDGIFYVLGPSKVYHLGPLSVEGICLIGGVLMPSKQFQPGRDEHLHIRRFTDLVASLALARDRYTYMTEHRSHPEQAAYHLGEARRLTAALAELGFGPSSIELAVRMVDQDLHPRTWYETVLAVEA